MPGSEQNLDWAFWSFILKLHAKGGRGFLKPLFKHRKTDLPVTALTYFTWKVVISPCKGWYTFYCSKWCPSSLACMVDIGQQAAPYGRRAGQHIRWGWSSPSPRDILLCVLSLCSLWKSRWLKKKSFLWSFHHGILLNKDALFSEVGEV